MTFATPPACGVFVFPVIIILMRTKARVDSNHNEIRDGLRQLGASVFDTARLGKGFGDLVVGFRGENFILEIKQPGQQNRLTPDEADFALKWRGQYAVVTTIEEAMQAVGIQTPDEIMQAANVVE